METIDAYLEHLASSAPTPGGGSAAAIVAAFGAALVAMVARICIASPKYEEYRDLASRLMQRADALRAELLEARVTDEAAFAKVVEAQALPRDVRTQALESALYGAAEAPLQAAGLALEVERLAGRLLEIPNPNLTSDIGCAVEFAAAAVTACAYNVRINHRFMKDANAIAFQAERIARYEREAKAIERALRMV